MIYTIFALVHCSFKFFCFSSSFFFFAFQVWNFFHSFIVKVKKCFLKKTCFVSEFLMKYLKFNEETSSKRLRGDCFFSKQPSFLYHRFLEIESLSLCNCKRFIVFNWFNFLMKRRIQGLYWYHVWFNTILAGLKIHSVVKKSMHRLQLYNDDNI